MILAKYLVYSVNGTACASWTCALQTAKLIWFKALPQSYVQSQLLSHSVSLFPNFWYEIKNSKIWGLNELIFVEPVEQSLAHSECSSDSCCFDHHFLSNVFMLVMIVYLDVCPLSHELFLVSSVSSLSWAPNPQPARRRTSECQTRDIKCQFSNCWEHPIKGVHCVVQVLTNVMFSTSLYGEIC